MTSPEPSPSDVVAALKQAAGRMLQSDQLYTNPGQQDLKRDALRRKVDGFLDLAEVIEKQGQHLEFIISEAHKVLGLTPPD